MRIKILVLALLYTVFLSSCAASIHPNLSEESAKKIVQEYFLEKYNINTSFVNLDEVQIGEHQFVNTITVSYQNIQYELCLNTANKPLCDNKASVDRQEEFNKNDFKDQFLAHDLYFHEYHPPNTNLDYQENCYKFTVFANTDTIPLYKNKSDMYNILKKLKSSGVDELVILINTPLFLRPAAHGLQLGGMHFQTDLSETAFDDKYKELVGEVYYDETKLTDFIQILVAEGIKNPYFGITDYRDGSTLELNLYSESTDNNSIELIKEQLEKVDESYFYMKDTKIGLTIVIKDNGEFDEIIYR